MTKYEVNISQFTGPLGKLLELIEAQHLEITQISLAEVTADFLRYVKNIGEKVEPGTLADFLVVAAKLVLIKSKVLLPILELTKEEEEEIHDLEGRLKIYQEFKLAGEHLRTLWDKNKPAHSRPLFLNLGEGAVFSPPLGLKAETLAQAIQNLAAALQALIPEQQTVKKSVVTIEQKIEELLNRFKEASRQSFVGLTKEKTRGEVIILFLAILHLVKDKLIQAEQGARFSDITVQKIS